MCTDGRHLPLLFCAVRLLLNRRQKINFVPRCGEIFPHTRGSHSVRDRIRCVVILKLAQENPSVNGRVLGGRVKYREAEQHEAHRNKTTFSLTLL